MIRWDRPEGKRIRPVSLYSDGWRIAGMPEPRPLYRLPDLVGAERVFIVEGEKAVEAARSLGLVATTSAHGAESAGKTGWTPLAGKETLVLPDNNYAGEGYKGDVAAILARLTPAPTIKVARLPGLPDGGDIADWRDQREAHDPAELKAEIESMADAAEVIKPASSEVDPAQPQGITRQRGDTAFTAYGDLAENKWPDPIDTAAYHGLAGEIVHAIEPHSEADPVALPIRLLVGFGNVIGRSAHFVAEADQHFGNLFAVLVGRTSKGRKVSSWGHVRHILKAFDPDWASDRVLSGLSSGEGLIWSVRDPIIKKERIKERGILSYEEVEADPGEADKRALILESEFASTLRVLGRDGNTLSDIIRQAWDTGSLRTLTKNSPAKDTGAHISIIGHVTKDELRRYLTNTEAGNGFANRFLWMCVCRSKAMPEGGRLHEVNFTPLVNRLKAAIEFAQAAGLMRRDDQSSKAWAAVYEGLSEGLAGLLGAVTSRTEAQTMRLAMLYALLDQLPVIRPEHPKAGLAIWEYCERSARYIFGSAMGDPTADEILRVLRTRPDGMSRSDLPGALPAEQVSRRSGPRADGTCRTRNGAMRAQHRHGRPAGGGLVFTRTRYAVDAISPPYRVYGVYRVTSFAERVAR